MKGILEFPGAAGWDDTIFLGDGALQEREEPSPALQVNFRSKIAFTQNYRMVPTSNPWVSEVGQRLAIYR